MPITALTEKLQWRIPSSTQGQMYIYQRRGEKKKGRFHDQVIQWNIIIPYVRFKVQLKQHRFNGGPESESRCVMTNRVYHSKSIHENNELKTPQQDTNIKDLQNKSDTS